MKTQFHTCRSIYRWHPARIKWHVPGLQMDLDCPCSTHLLVVSSFSISSMQTVDQWKYLQKTENSEFLKIECISDIVR